LDCGASYAPLFFFQSRILTTNHTNLHEIGPRAEGAITYPQLKDALVEKGFSGKDASYIEDIGMHLFSFQKSR